MNIQLPQIPELKQEDVSSPTYRVFIVMMDVDGAHKPVMVLPSEEAAEKYLADRTRFGGDVRYWVEPRLLIFSWVS